MIVGSLLLLLTGVAMLVVGLFRGEDTYLVGAIVASLLAAVCLYGASRRRKTEHSVPAKRAERPERPVRTARSSGTDDVVTDSRLRGREREDEPVAAKASRPRDESADTDDFAGSGHKTEDVDVETDAVPADEPAEVPMSSVEAAALMRMDAEVMVVDGRPRFHLGGCVHLTGRDAESLPAYEAVELGFSACGLCRPAQTLLREPTRR